MPLTSQSRKAPSDSFGVKAHRLLARASEGMQWRHWTQNLIGVEAGIVSVIISMHLVAGFFVAEFFLLVKVVNGRAFLWWRASVDF